VRDLGGLPTGDGGTTRFGAVVRADNVGRLSAAGWDELVAYGIRRVVDLRFEEERERDPERKAPVELVRISLFGAHDPAEAARIDDLTRTAPDTAAATTRMYLHALEKSGTAIASAVRAVACAPDGGVVVHCFIGKDRTGIVSALLLGAVGVTDDVVAQDYALSDDRVRPLVDRWIASAEEEHERAYRRRVCSAPEQGMQGMLAGLRERWGSAEAYLHSIGVSPLELDRLRARLVA
jgi:protein tyrosine/serine phosphatase